MTNLDSTRTAPPIARPFVDFHTSEWERRTELTPHWRMVSDKSFAETQTAAIQSAVQAFTKAGYRCEVLNVFLQQTPDQQQSIRKASFFLLGGASGLVAHIDFSASATGLITSAVSLVADKLELYRVEVVVANLNWGAAIIESKPGSFGSFDRALLMKQFERMRFFQDTPNLVKVQVTGGIQALEP